MHLLSGTGSLQPTMPRAWAATVATCKEHRFQIGNVQICNNVSLRLGRRISESVCFPAAAARFACPHCVASIVRAFKLAAGGRLGEHSPPLSRIESFK